MDALCARRRALTPCRDGSIVPPAGADTRRIAPHRSRQYNADEQRLDGSGTILLGTEASPQVSTALRYRAEGAERPSA